MCDMTAEGEEQEQRKSEGGRMWRRKREADLTGELERGEEKTDACVGLTG